MMFALLLFLALTTACIEGINASDENSPSAAVTGKISSCKRWHEAEPHPSVLLKQIRKCPCNVPRNFPNEFNDGSEIWTTDIGCMASLQPHTCKYHKGAHGCYRFAYERRGPGAQCCYDSAAVWISDPHQGAGTIDRERAPDDMLDFSQWNAHNKHDVIPWENCCKDPAVPRHVCQLYFDKRPSGECANYEIRSIGRSMRNQFYE